MNRRVLRLIVKKRLTTVLYLIETLATFQFLHFLFELSLKLFLTSHCHIRLIVPLWLRVDSFRTFVRIVAHLIAVVAVHTHVLHLTHRVHHLNST